MDDAPAPRPRLRDQLRLFGLALAAVAVVGLLAGWLFAKGSPSTAAGAVIAPFVEDEPPGVFDGDASAPTDLVAPSWGAHADGIVRCGVVEAVTPADHLASLAAGVVVFRHRPDLPADDLADLAELASRREVLVAPAPGLDNPLEAVAWGRRLRFSTYNREWTRAFHAAYVDAPVPDADVDLPATCNGA